MVHAIAPGATIVELLFNMAVGPGLTGRVEDLSGYSPDVHAVDTFGASQRRLLW